MADERIDIEIRDKINDSIITKLDQIAAKAKLADAAIVALKGNMNGFRLSGLNSQMARTNQVMTQKVSLMGRMQTMYSSLSSRIVGLVSNYGRLHAQTLLLTNSSLGLIRSLRTIASIAIIGSVTGGAVASLDSYRQLNNQLISVSKNAAQLKTVQNELFEVANRGRVPVGDIAKAYRRFDMAIEGLGGSQKESLRLTETISKMLVLNGATTQEAAASLLQLSQAFNKGKLDGDEFRSVGELMPQVLNKVAKVLGKTRGQLYDLSREGQITTEVLRKAFSELAPEIDKLLGRAPRTIGQSITQLSNELIRFFGELDAKFKISDRIIAFFDWMRGNLPTVVKFLEAMVAAFLVISTSTIIGSLFSIIGAFASMGGILGAVVAYFVFFGDKIKVTADGLVSFRDIFFAAFEEIRQMIFSVGGEFSKFINGSGGQWFVTTVMIPALETLKNALINVTSFVVAFYQTIQNFDSATLFTALGESVKRTFAGAFNYVVEFAKQVIDVITSMIEGALNQINSSLPRFLQSAKGFDLTPNLQQLDQFKFKLESLTPTLDQVGTNFDANFTSNVNLATFAFDFLQNRILQRARETAIERISLEGNVAQRIVAINSQVGQFVQQTWRTISNVSRIESLNSVQGWSQMMSQLTSLFESGKNIIINIISQIVAAIGQAVNALSGLIGQAAAAKGLAALGAASGIPGGGLAGSVLPTSFDNAGALRGVNDQLVQQNALLNQVATANDGAAQAAQNFTNGAQQGMNGLNNATDNYLQNFQQLASQAFGHVTDAIIEFTNTGKFEFKKMMKAIVDDLLRFFLNRFFSKMLGSLFGGGGMGGGLFGGLFGGGFGGGLGGGGLGFASGGYTGNIGTNKVAGVVHGREFVMPANRTKQYRSQLEAMKAGRPSSVGSPVMNVKVENYTNSKIQVERLSATDVRIIASEIAEKTVQSRTPRLVADQLRDSNSRVSKSLGQNTNTSRRR